MCTSRSKLSTFDQQVIWFSRAAGVDKLITFEYSHFLSPNSMFESAHGLHRLYAEWRRGLEGGGRS